MFTEQPAPPHPVAEVQVQVDNAAPAAPPTPARVAAPEVVVTPIAAPAAPAPVAEPTPTPAATPAPTPTPAATSPAPATTPNAATAQRRQEIEQTLLELTSKARAEQQAKQREQAETEAAKYGEAGELEEAQKIINNPALPANVRAALLKRLQAKQAKKGNKTITAKGTKPSTKVTPSSQSGLTPVGGSGNYATAPIIPLSQAQMQLRLGQLIGRNLNFAFPLSIPAPITSLFGWRIHPISGSPRFHRGIDFGAPMGTPIVAAKAGQVQTADTLDGYGLTVIVQHGKTQQTLYGHMSQIFVKPGDVVQKGQLLGLVGSTGNSTGPHLHFEVHEATTEGWVALDPAIALNGAIALAQNPPALAAASRKPQSFNLALSGLLDINLPTQTLPGFRLGNTALSGALMGWGMPQDEIPAIGLQMSLALLPPTLPELGWLISPWVDDLAAQLALPLPGWAQLAQTFSFQPVPSLTTVPALPPGSVPVAFDPTDKLPAPTQFQLSTSKSLAGLTIAEQVPSDIRRVPQPNSLSLVAPALPPNRDRDPVTR